MKIYFPSLSLFVIRLLDFFLKSNNLIHMILIGLLGIFLFFRADPSRISVEKNIYDFYAESIVIDKDLNLMNQVPVKDRWQMTRSGNYPDVHSNGIISFWYPFFIYKNFISTNVPLQELQLITLTRTMATSFYAFLAIILMFYWMRIQLQIRVSIFQVMTFFLGSSFFWYAIFQPGNADVTSLFLALMTMIIFPKALKENTFSLYLLLGLLLGVGVGLKVDHLFFLIIPAYLIIQMFQKSYPKKIIAQNILCFSIAFTACVVPISD